MQRLTQADYKRTRWKNGGGETFELAIWPAGGTLDDFEWRISMATITTSGPFSRFPGVERTLCLIEGTGFDLVMDDVTHPLTAVSDPFCFSGDAHGRARLTHGVVRDLNVMTRRDRFAHLVTAKRVGHRLGAEGNRFRYFVASTSSQLATVAGNLSLDCLDVLRLETGETAELTRGSGWLTSLWPI